MKWLLISSLTICAVLFLIFLSLVLFTRNKSPVQSSIYINTDKSNVKPLCSQQLTDCNTDQDCETQCYEGKDTECKEINFVDGKAKKCVSREAKIDCDADKGGVVALSYQTNPARIEWDCICNNPYVYNGQNCKELNAGLCTGGTYSGTTCVCGSGTTLVPGTSICAPNTVNQNLYSNK